MACSKAKQSIILMILIIKPKPSVIFPYLLVDPTASS